MTDDRTSSGSGPPAPSESRPLGPALAAAREGRGLSVEDVSASTRIRATLVRAIEGDDFSRCGGAVYARGHIKSMAQVVGADPRELVAEFDRRYGDPAPTVTASPLPAFEPSGARPNARWASVAVAVLAVAAVFFGFSWLLGRNEDGGGVSASQPTPSATEATTTTPPAASPTTTSPRPTPTKSARPSGVTLRVRAAEGASWLRVTTSGGEQVYQGVLALGQQVDFRDGRSLTVRFGNSPAVRLTVNGQDVGAPRCDSIVCSVEYLPPGASAG